MDRDAKVPEKTGLDMVSNNNHVVTAVSQEAPGGVASVCDDARLEKMCSTEKSADVVYSVYSKSVKRMIILIAVVAGFSSQLTTSIYYPALTTIAHPKESRKAWIENHHELWQYLKPVEEGKSGSFDEVRILAEGLKN
ncbi:hypothetical protein BGZ57DRAFT_998073 [Hyaloscypha finlandica]|nr:hypothetical protein BGZ57DRAFT_998073 [Hyaloscypha finlandica]